jgi:hypothetical protein
MTSLRMHDERTSECSKNDASESRENVAKIKSGLEKRIGDWRAGGATMLVQAN